MRKIVVLTFISLDGVMQAPGGPDEDTTGGFKYGGWTVPFSDDTSGQMMVEQMSMPFDLLLGRKTYEIFAAHWPYAEGGPDDGIAKLFKEIRKYPVSRSGDVDTSWTATTLLRSVDDVKRLKQEAGPDLVTQGSTELVHALLAADLVDEIKVFTAPVLLGGGKKLFADGSAAHSYKLIGSRVSSSGIVIAHYQRAGDLAIGDTALENPSEAETARQDRMKREG